MRRLPGSWERYWFGPLPSVRPFLFERACLLVLAFDLWILRIPRGGLYGEPNLAHFGWLDRLQPAQTPSLYVGVLLVAGVLSLVVALGGGSILTRLLLVAAYTWSWAMSRLDGFQHHYLLSWVLLCVAFFPRRYEREERREAWSWTLLGASLAIVYAFTAVAKLEASWLEGSIVRRLAEQAGTASLAEAWLGAAGVDGEAVWRLVAWAVIGAEMLVAAAYLAAPRRDDAGARGIRSLAVLGGVVAIAMHAGIEIFLDLQIGWFSAYTLLAAATFFAPLGLLAQAEKLVAGVGRCAGSCARTFRRVLGARTGGALLAGASVAFLVAAGNLAGLPAAPSAMALLALLLLADASFLLARGEPSRAGATAGAAVIAGLALIVTLEVSPARYDFHDRLGGELARRGEHAAALAAYHRLSLDAPRFPPERPVAAYVRERRIEALRRALAPGREGDERDAGATRGAPDSPASTLPATAGAR